MQIILFLHVLVVFVAFGMLVFPGIFTVAMAPRLNDVAQVRLLFGIIAKRGEIGGPLLLVGALIGLWYAYVVGYSLTSGWLIASYICLAAIMVLGIGYHSRWEKQVFALAKAAPDGPITPELRTALRTHAGPLNFVAPALFVLILYFMTTKPF